MHQSNTSCSHCTLRCSPLLPWGPSTSALSGDDVSWFSNGNGFVIWWLCRGLKQSCRGLVVAFVTKNPTAVAGPTDNTDFITAKQLLQYDVLTMKTS